MGTHKYETLSSLKVGLRTSLRRSPETYLKRYAGRLSLAQVHDIEFKSEFEVMEGWLFLP